MTDILNLAGRVALITGAGQGVGRQIAIDFAAHGAAGVIVNDYFADRAEAVAAEVRAAGGKAVAMAADVTSYDAMTGALTQAVAALGAVDILVNNAGNAGAAPSRGGFGKPFWETSPEDWAPWLAVNLNGVMNCCRLCAPAMVAAGRGRIVTIISDAGRMGEPGLEAYSAAKAGAAGLTRALARSLGRFNVTANCVAISATATPATARALENPELLKKMMNAYVIRRPGQPSDVSAMALFLASEASGWITGQTYPVNGGFSFAL